MGDMSSSGSRGWSDVEGRVGSVKVTQEQSSRCEVWRRRSGFGAIEAGDCFDKSRLVAGRAVSRGWLCDVDQLERV